MPNRLGTAQPPNLLALPSLGLAPPEGTPCQPLTAGPLLWDGSGQQGGTAEIWEALCLLSGEGDGGCWTPLLLLGPLMTFVPSPVCTILTFVLLTQSLALWVLLLLCRPGMCHFTGTST